MSEGAALDFDCVEKVSARRETFGWTIKTAPAKPRRESKPAESSATATLSTAIEIKSYSDLILVLRTRCDELKISRETVDFVAGLQSGYSAKVLSIKKVRRLGQQSFGLLLNVLGLKLIAIPVDADLDKSELISSLRCRAKKLSREGVIGMPVDHISRISLETLGSVLQVLSLKLMAVPDEEALARNRSRLTERDDAHFRSATARHSRSA